MSRPVSIILAEDDDGHADLIQRNFQRAGVLNSLTRVCDGQDAVDLIRGEGRFSEHPVAGPLLLVLDIRMPRLDGVEVLKIIKSDPKTAQIPIIILTTTDDPREIDRCYRLGCNVYVTKPVEYQAFIEAIRRIGLFLQVVEVPKHDSGIA